MKNTLYVLGQHGWWRTHAHSCLRSRQHWAQPQILKGQSVILSPEHCCNVRAGGVGGGGGMRGRTETGRNPRMLRLTHCVYTNKNCFRQCDPTPIEQWGPRLLWHLRKTGFKTRIMPTPTTEQWASVITFGGVVLVYLEDKMGFFRPRISDPSTLAERNSQQNEPLEIKPA